MPDAELYGIPFSPEPLDVPEVCRTCPAVLPLIKKNEQLQRDKVVAQTIGEQVFMGGMPEGIRESLIEHLGEEHGSVLSGSGTTPEEALTKIEEENRKRIGIIIENLDEAIDDNRLAAYGLTSTCRRPLALRAAKDDIEYTVTICTSVVPNGGSNNAVIKRKLKKNKDLAP